MAQSDFKSCPGNSPFGLVMVDFDCCGTQCLAEIQASYILETLVQYPSYCTRTGIELKLITPYRLVPFQKVEIPSVQIHCS